MPARSGPLRPHPYCHPPRRAPTDRAAVICARQKEGVAPSYRESRRGSRFYIDDEAWSRRTWQKACGLWMDAKDHQVRGLWLLHTVPMADISSRWRLRPRPAWCRARHMQDWFVRERSWARQELSVAVAQTRTSSSRKAAGMIAPSRSRRTRTTPFERPITSKPTLHSPVKRLRTSTSVPVSIPWSDDMRTPPVGLRSLGRPAQYPTCYPPGGSGIVSGRQPDLSDMLPSGRRGKHDPLRAMPRARSGSVQRVGSVQLGSSAGEKLLHLALLSVRTTPVAPSSPTSTALAASSSCPTSHGAGQWPESLLDGPRRRGGGLDPFVWFWKGERG